MDNKDFMRAVPPDRKELAIYRILGKSFTQADLDFAYTQGLIPMPELVDGALYRGYCRNTTKARWVADRRAFSYSRYKFGTYFDDEIEPPELDRGFDIFVAVERIDE